MSALHENPTSPASSEGGAPQPLLGGVWHVRLLGALEARNGDVTLRHFVSRPIAAMLARLALQPHRLHPREELVELLWPGVEIDVGRNRLRNAISSLRRLLEPPGSAPGAVLIADRQGLQLAPGASRCDVLDFERSVREKRFEDARRAYAGELMPGFYEDWVQDERARVAALLERAEKGAAASAAAPPASPATFVAASGSAANASAAPRAADPATAVPLLVSPMPPARASRALPGYLTGYFGREAERTQLAAAVAAGRLVTLTGMGGAGKTRLAVEVARDVTGFDTVAFAALADCFSAAQAAAQLRVALQLPAAGEALDSVVACLAGGRPLLVLDNFEQLVATDGVELVEALLQRLPALHLLVTSRRVLGLAGEREFPLVPLPQPDPSAGLSSVARSPSVALFVDRARSVRPDFQVTERNHEALASLCCALEGMPLAIELAASRSRAFTPKDMHAALAQRFALLARPGARAAKAPLRHDTLRAAIDWSWQLLSPQQQRFLVALSVFRGGWSVASAEAVCAEPDARTLLEGLAADSLLRVEHDESGPIRFGMLEMIRDFLRERLAEGEARALRRSHREHYLSMAGDTVDEAELLNFNEALRSAVDDHEHGFALTLGLALKSHWDRNGIDPEALALLGRALDHATAHDDVWAGACTMTALLSLTAGDVAGAHARANAALASAAPHSYARAAALCAHVRIESEAERHTLGLESHLGEAMAIAQRLGAVDIEAQCLGAMSMLTLRQKQGAEKADAYAVEARRLYRSIGLDREASALLYERAMCLLELRLLPEALVQARQLEQESLALGDRHRQLKAMNQQGVILAAMRRWPDALASYGRCVQLAWQMHNDYWLAFALWNHCRNLARMRQPERAALLMAFSVNHWTTHFGILAGDDLRFVRQVRALVKHQLGAVRLESLWADGVKLTMSQAVRLALS